MSCDNVITVQDLETDKKHSTFYREVITGKVGGIGADIDSATNAVTGQTQATLPKVLSNVGFSPAGFDFTTGGTLGAGDRDKAVYNPAPNGDNNWYSWCGVLPKVIPAGSKPETTGGFGSDKWVLRSAYDHATLQNRNVENAHNAQSITRGSGTVESSISDIENDINSIESELDLSSKKILIDRIASGLISNEAASGFVGRVKGCAILGDSISHGAHAGDLYSNGWTRLLARSYSSYVGAKSYGFVPLLNMVDGQGGVSKDIHSISFTGTWLTIEGSPASESISGVIFRSSQAGDKIRSVVPSFMRYVTVHYVSGPASQTSKILINGVQLGVTAQSASVNGAASVTVQADDNLYGLTVIDIVADGAGAEITGISYVSPNKQGVNNFSQSGRRARYLSDNIIDSVCANSRTLIFALGHNDASSTDPAYIADTTSRIDRIISKSNLNGVDVVVPDFCWSFPESNWMRLLLVRLAKETGGIYINLPSELSIDGVTPAGFDRLTNVLKMFSDSSHPNSFGNSWIFSTVARRIGLSVTDKQSALTKCDFDLSLEVNQLTQYKNLVVTSPSTCKRSASGIVYNVLIQGGTNLATESVLALSVPQRSGYPDASETVIPIYTYALKNQCGTAITSAGGAVTLKTTATTGGDNKISSKFIA